MSFESRDRTQDIFRKCCVSSSLGSPDRRWPGNSGGLHSTVRAGGCATLGGITETFLAVTLQRRFPNPLLVNVRGG